MRKPRPKSKGWKKSECRKANNTSNHRKQKSFRIFAPKSENSVQNRSAGQCAQTKIPVRIVVDDCTGIFDVNLSTVLYFQSYGDDPLAFLLADFIVESHV